MILLFLRINTLMIIFFNSFLHINIIPQQSVTFQTEHIHVQKKDNMKNLLKFNPLSEIIQRETELLYHYSNF